MGTSVLAIDWHEMLIPTMGLLELFIRGSVMYLAILVLLRLFRRNSGSLSTADLLVLVMIADAAQDGMAAKYNSVTEGIVLVTTIFFWNYALDWLSYRVPAIHRILEPAPVTLVLNGRLKPANLRSEMLTRDDVMEQLREQGVDSLAQVKHCCLESDGHISVVRR